MPRPILDRLGLKASLVGRTALNIPPASVYRIRRRPKLRIVGNADEQAQDVVAGISE